MQVGQSSQKYSTCQWDDCMAKQHQVTCKYLPEQTLSTGTKLLDPMSWHAALVQYRVELPCGLLLKLMRLASLLVPAFHLLSSEVALVQALSQLQLQAVCLTVL